MMIRGLLYLVMLNRGIPGNIHIISKLHVKSEVGSEQGGDDSK